MTTRIERVSVGLGSGTRALRAAEGRELLRGAAAIIVVVAAAMVVARLGAANVRETSAAVAPAAAVPFVPRGLAMTRTVTGLFEDPACESEMSVLAPGTRLVVGGIVPVRAGLRRREALWVRVESGGAARFGFVASDAAVLAMGVPPTLDLRAVSVEQLLAPIDGGDVPMSDGAGLAARGSDAGATEIGIPWLPETVSRWSALIVKSAVDHGVDPDLVAIVILVESGGHPGAVSSSGAMGLMQVMPATAADIAGRRGIAGHETRLLHDPAYNIDLGTWYLAEMLRSFGLADDPDWQQSVELAAAAYNGGPGMLQRFLRSGGGLPAESARYRRWVGGMWSERGSAASAGFDSWMAAGGALLVESARKTAPS